MPRACQQGARRANHLGVAAGHDRQAGFAGADVAAGDRGIDAGDPPGGRSRGNGHGQRRLAGAHVDEDRAGAAASQRTVLAQHHGADLGRIADHGEDHVRRCGDGLGGIGPAGAAGQQRLGLRPRAAVDGRLEAGLQQMAAHAGAHHAGADPADAGLSGCDLHQGRLVFQKGDSPIFVGRKSG